MEEEQGLYLITQAAGTGDCLRRCFAFRATPGALQVSVDGQYVSLGSPAIENDGTTGLAMTQINSHTFQVPLTSGDIRTVPVQVVWQYRGSYSGVDLPTIECGGSITVTR